MDLEGSFGGHTRRVPLTLGLLGHGRLGAAIRAVVEAADPADVRIGWFAGREGPQPGAVDVAVDVSAAEALPSHLAWADRTGTPLVVGTTGWEPRVLEAVGPGQRVLVAPNFSIGVAVVRRLALLLGRYTAASPLPADLAVTETHHRHKADAPSGTALALRAALAEGAGRRPEEVQTTSLRLGEVVGEHEVVLSTALETLTLGHRAHARELFAAGAVAAARWLAARPEPGTYTLDDLAEEHLRSLLRPEPRHTPSSPHLTKDTR